MPGTVYNDDLLVQTECGTVSGIVANGMRTWRGIRNNGGRRFLQGGFLQQTRIAGDEPTFRGVCKLLRSFFAPQI